MPSPIRDLWLQTAFRLHGQLHPARSVTPERFDAALDWVKDLVGESRLARAMVTVDCAGDAARAGAARPLERYLGFREAHPAEPLTLWAISVPGRAVLGAPTSLIWSAGAAPSVQWTGPLLPCDDLAARATALARIATTWLSPDYGYAGAVPRGEIDAWTGARERPLTTGSPLPWNARVRRLAQQGASRELRSALRDVFPWQWLSTDHAALRLDGETLASWIDAAQGRGRWERDAQGEGPWIVPDAGIAAVRSVLDRAGLLFASSRGT